MENLSDFAIFSLAVSPVAFSVALVGVFYLLGRKGKERI